MTAGALRWATAGVFALAGSSLRAASVSLNHDDPADKVVGAVVSETIPASPTGDDDRAPAGNREEADGSLFNSANPLEPDWITLKLANEPFEDEEYSVVATRDAADEWFLAPRQSLAGARTPVNPSVGDSVEVLAAGNTIPLPPGVVTGSIGLLALLGGGLIRRALQIYR